MYALRFALCDLRNLQLHKLKFRRKKKIRVGRGGKRGGYSGRGQKGQKSRAGSRIRLGFRGGDTPVWKLFPKQRGASKKTKIKHRFFDASNKKPQALNVGKINNVFKVGEKINLQTLYEKGLIRSIKQKIKILADGEIDKKLEFDKLIMSSAAKKKILDAGGIIN